MDTEIAPACPDQHGYDDSDAQQVLLNGGLNVDLTAYLSSTLANKGGPLVRYLII